MLSAILKRLGLDVEGDEPRAGAEALHAIVDALEHMEPTEARYVAAFAYLLNRVAHADHAASDAERESIERTLVEHAGLSSDHASLVAQLASSQTLRVRGTQDFLVTREFAAIASHEQKRALIDSLYAVSAADTSIITVEDNEIRRIASQIGLEHRELVSIRQQYRHKLAVLHKEGTEGGGPDAGDDE